MFVTDSGEPRQPAYRLFGITVFALLLFSLSLLAWALVSVARGEPDSYPNQRLRLLAGGLGQTFIAAYLVATWRARFRRVTLMAVVFLVAALCAIAWNFVLAAA